MQNELNRPLVHEKRPATHIRPVKALQHFRSLIADKEDTEQVFHIVHALRRRSEVHRLKRFFDSDEGRALYLGEPELPPMLDDHDALRKLPKGSVAHAYCDFMEAEGLSAQGLVDEYAKFEETMPAYDDLFHWYENRVRDTHDLQHILSGYGRDALGEQCVLAFNYGAVRNYGVLFIAYAGLIEVRRHVPAGTPILQAVNEAKRNGRQALPIMEQRIAELLPMPLQEARAMLGYGEPRTYRAAHAHMRSAGYNPYDLLKPQNAATA